MHGGEASPDEDATMHAEAHPWRGQWGLCGYPTMEGPVDDVRASHLRFVPVSGSFFARCMFSNNLYLYMHIANYNICIHIYICVILARGPQTMFSVSLKVNQSGR